MRWRKATSAVTTNSDPTILALRLEHTGRDQLRVIWNRNALPVARASEGTLVIRDGTLPEQKMHLDTDQLRFGSVLDNPLHPDVQFQLEIRESGGSGQT